MDSVGNLISQVEVKTIDHAQQVVKIPLVDYSGALYQAYQSVTGKMMNIPNGWGWRWGWDARR